MPSKNAMVVGDADAHGNVCVEIAPDGTPLFRCFSCNRPAAQARELPDGTPLYICERCLDGESANYRIRTA